MASPPAETSTPEPPLFRASRKRKANNRRQRQEDDDDTEPTATTPSHLPDAAASTAPSAPAEDSDPSIAEALRLRTLRRSRLNGVGFRAQSRDDESTTTSSSRALVLKPQDEDTAPDGGITNRFAPQTGLVGELVNKHMMEYIESKLSNRPSQSTPSPAPASSASPAPPAPATHRPTDEPAGAAIMQGRLAEVDLGDEARARNIAMTERARLHGTAGAAGGAAATAGGSGDADLSDPAAAQRVRKKPRLGRDGKPWRQRNRRTSDDLARDKLVEDILRENRLDVYENPTPPQSGTPAAPDDDADDRLAEEFRRDFMDAMAQRRQQNAQQRKKAPAGGAGGGGGGPGKPDEDVLRGPKLGGSRSARAAMRDLLLAEEKKKQGRR
ncbi:hypothetical protein ACHAQA_004171 [Verticillium albo-atrum]